MTDSITEILANTEVVFKTKDNDLGCVVIVNNGNGKKTSCTLNFSYDGVTVGRTVVNNNKIEVISNIHEYSREVFLFVLKNFNTLMGNINEFNNTVNFTLNNIPAMVFSNSVFKIKEKKRDGEEEEIYNGDKYVDDFIIYNNKNFLINNNNYFTFLKVTVEAGNLQIFDYLGNTYDEYKNNLSEEQMAILIYTACKRNSKFIAKMHGLNFTFGFEVLKLTIDNNDCEMLDYLHYSYVNDINAAVDRNNETILDYAIGRNNIEMVKYLITVKNMDIGGSIILYIRQNPEIIELLYERYDIANILKISYSYNGWSVAHEIAKNENLEIVKPLFERENITDILGFSDDDGRSVAHVIAGNKNPGIVGFLFKRKDIINILKMGNLNGWSVAHAIAKNENPEIVRLLFKREDIINILKMGTSSRWSVAHEIARNGNPEVVKLLFEREDIKKDILNMRTPSKWSITHTIAENVNPEVIKFLLTREDVKLEKRDFKSIKENFSYNEEIMNLLILRGLTNTNNTTKEVSVINENKTPEEINTSKACTIC